MNKFAKIAAGLAVLVVVVVVALMVLAKVLITPERVKTTVLPLAREALQREVRLGDIEVSLFSGITLQDLAIEERGGGEPFVAIDRVVLRYRLWPLLFMRVVVDEVRLEAPAIRVERLADGSFNFSDLIAGKEGGAPSATEALEPASEGAQPIDLLVSKVAVSGGELLLVDHVLNPEAPFRYRLSDFRLEADDIALDRAFPFKVAGLLDQAPFSVVGEVNPQTLTGRAAVELSALDVGPFSPYFKEQLPGIFGGARLDVKVEAEGGRERVASKGSVAVSELSLTLDDLKDAPLRDAALALDYDVDLDLQGGALAISDGRVAFNEIPLYFRGKLERLFEAPGLDLEAELKGLDLRKAVDSLPAGLVDLSAFGLGGGVSARVRLAGTAAEPLKLLQGGTVTLDEVQADVGGLRPALAGTLKLGPDSVTAEGLTIRAGDNRATLDLSAGNLFGKPIAVTTAVRSERFALDPLLQSSAAPVAAGAPVGSTGAPAASAEEIGPLDLPLTADGTVQIGETLYKGLAVTDFDLHYHLESNVLTVDRLTGKVAGGTFSQTARVDLGRKGLDYRTKLGIASIQADPLVTAFLPRAAGTLFGSLTLDTELSGRGTLPAALKKNLSGGGELLVGEGKLTGAGLVRGLADYLHLEELRSVTFSQAKGNFRIEDGKVRFDSAVSGHDLRMKPQGTVGLDGGLDLGLDARLSPELTGKLDRKGQFSQFFTDAEGWGQLPLKVTGTAGAPRFVLDTSAVKERAKEKAKEEVQKQLQEKVFEKLAPKEGEAPDPTKEMLKDTLRGLFGN